MKSAQGGQVLPVGIALLLVMSVAVFVLYNTGQAATDKARIANTSDAAAYSGLLWQSRAMNFQAYTNRAMVANQVAMAQAVSLNSWSKYAVHSTTNMRTVLGGIPYVNAVVAAANTAAKSASIFLDPITDGMLIVIDPINRALSRSQEAMYLSAFVATPEVIGNVVTANDSRFEWDTAFSTAGLANNLQDWKKLTESIDSDHRAGMEERAEIIRQSTDNFTQQRNWKFFNNWFPLSPLAFVQAQRYGGTRLMRGKNGEYEWKAKDTVALHTKIYRPFRSKKVIELPIGWAESFINNEDSNKNRSIEKCGQRPELCQDWFGRNRLSQSLAENSSNNEIKISYSGVQAYRSLSDAVRESADSPSVKLRVEVALPEDLVNDTTNTLASARLASGVKAVGKKMTSVSTAELYYERPNEDRHDEKEYANSYNAFWDVRLVETTGYERMAALAGRVTAEAGVAPKTRLASLQSYNPENPLPVGDGERKQRIYDLGIALVDTEAQLVSAVKASARHSALEDRKIRLELMLNRELALVKAENGNDLSKVASSASSAVAVLALASGSGLEHADYQQTRGELESYANNTVSDVRAMFSDEIERFGNGVADVIKDELEGTLKTALADILGGVVNRGSTVKNFAELKKEEIDQIIDDKGLNYIDNGIAESIKSADKAIKVLTEKFKKVRHDVTTQFEVEVAAVKDKYEQRENNLRAQAQQVMDAVVHAGEKEIEEARRRANEILRPIADSHDLIVDDLTGKLMSIMRKELPDYAIREREARKAVELALQVNGDEVVDSLHILDLENEDD